MLTWPAGVWKGPRRFRFARLVRTGNAANRDRDWAAARRAYAAALRLDPSHAPIWVQYGHSLKEQGYLQQAEAAYRRAAGLDGASADIRLQLGHVLNLTGDRAGALAAYEAAHALDPAMLHGRVEIQALRTAMAENRDAEQGQGCPGNVPGFDAFYYHQANPAVRAALPRPDHVACLAHFQANGIELGLAYSAQDGFDPDFYRATYLGGMPFTIGNAYRHWLATGLRAGAAPNRRRWIEDRLGPGGHALDDSDLTPFQGEEAGHEAGTAAVERFIAHAGDPAFVVRPTARTADAFSALASRLEAADPLSPRASRLRQVIAWHVPGHQDNRRAHAHALQRRGCLLEAATLYQAEPAAPWTVLGLATCQDGLGLAEDALATLGQGRAAYPGNAAIRAAAEDQARRFWGVEWKGAFALARRGHMPDAQDRIHRACGLICAAVALPAHSKVPCRPIRRVAVAVHQPLPQCRLYRVDQAIEQIEAAGCTAELLDLTTGPDALRAVAYRFDAVIFHRVPALPDVVASIVAAGELGLVTFYDIDDLIFGDAYPDRLESFAGLVSAEEHCGLALAAPLFEQAMQLCTFAIASTPSLAATMASRVRSGRAFVRPNALGRAHAAFLRDTPLSHPRGAGVVSVFYGSGTRAHKTDFLDLVEPALVELVRRYGDRVAITLMGDIPDSEGMRSIAGHITRLAPVWNVTAYWTILASADINLAVLRPSALTDAKSEIKWLEAAMLGIPSVVSDTARYRDIVRPGETGLVCTTAAKWTMALDQLAGDPGLRRRIGDAARRQALSEYGEAAMAAQVRAMLAEASPVEDPRPLVLIVHVYYPPHAVGGATRVVHDNVRDLAGTGGQFRYEVFTSIDGGPAYELTRYAQDGIAVTGVGAPPDPDLDHRAIDPRMGAIFGAVLDQLRPALVHFHCVQRLTASVVAAAADRGLPYLVTAHDGWWIAEGQFLLNGDGQIQTYAADPAATLRMQGMQAHARATVLRRALLKARHVLAVSERFATIYRDCGIPNVSTIANGVPVLAVDRPPPAQAGPVRLGFIGGMMRHKGFDLVRIALESRPFQNLTLLLIDHSLTQGQVRYERWGSVMIERRAPWPQSHVSALYAQIDVLLAPSLWPESFGLVTREALQCGCWIIASDRGSIGDCVTEGQNGFLVDVSSPDGLVAALDWVDQDAARYRTPPSTNGLALRRTEEQVAELTALYARLLA